MRRIIMNRNEVIFESIVTLRKTSTFFKTGNLGFITFIREGVYSDIEPTRKCG